eukprot:TRINITY_DN1850_c0_g1_i4.p1 TRINITY_DN1850_c0_g1~~TRINITY_DN1850_c0_g1_i4.p1  ORF type:complete len:223 (+),score=55.80 TRINITY_DN1850_c0_g1_i4:60-728(+)
MIVVLIRHSQSMNNHIASTHPETYDEERKDDPELSPLGVSQMKSLGLFLKSKGIVFDRYFCSPFYRALMSTKALFEAMDKPTDSVEILVPIHEYGGCNMKGKGYPGKSRAFIEEYFPGCRIPEEVTEEGWWKNPTKETNAEAIARTKGFLVYLKQMAKENSNKCFAFLTHGGFMSILFQLLENKGKIVIDEKNLVFATENASVSILRVHEKSIETLIVNHFI